MLAWVESPAHVENNLVNPFHRNTGPQPGDMIDMRMLVLCPHLQDPNLKALRRIMDYMGMRYDVLATSQADLTPDLLWRKTHAHYQGIVLTTGYLAEWNSALTDWYDPLSDDEWEALHAYQARFGIRLATFCGVPRVSVTTNALLIHEPVGAQEFPFELTLTDEGRRVFWYLQGDCRIPISSGTAIGVAPMTITSTPLLVAMDGLTYGAVWTTDDGCEYLALTLGHNDSALHTLLLAYGVINWVTCGVFLGERKVALSIQIDDIFTSNQLRDEDGSVGESGPIYRLTAPDIHALVHWLDRLHKERNAGDLALDFAFNGAAATPLPVDQAAVDAFVEHRRRFRWINHGYTHLLLDDADAASSREEIQRNHETARILNLAAYEPDCMVTADMSGLTNPAFLTAAAESGIRFLVSDTSRAGWDNPAPNTPIRSSIRHEITMIPRHPNNLFFDVATPRAWVAHYNEIYRSYWKRDLSFADIIEEQAKELLQYLLVGDIDPLMFHQANLHAYDGTHSLLSDLIDKLLAQYNEFFDSTPIQSLSMRAIGEKMVMRATYDQARIDASLIVGSGLILLANRDVNVPVTGVRIYGADVAYGGQTVATVALRANVTRSIPLNDLVGLNCEQFSTKGNGKAGKNVQL